MRSSTRTLAAYLTLLALAVWIAPASALAAGGDARIEGLMVGLDGRPASGMTVHLIDAGGQDVAAATVDDEGAYSFRDLPSGEYSLGVENAQGQMAPVAAPPVKVKANELARRDLKLMEADPAAQSSATVANYGLGQWWAGLTPAAKAWTVVAIIAVGGITWSALDDDNTNASPTGQ